jgi:hypothetical protein
LSSVAARTKVAIVKKLPGMQREREPLVIDKASTTAL